jgi:hypothetical protein
MTEQPMQDDRKTVYLDPFGLAKAWNKYRAHIIGRTAPAAGRARR